MFIFPADNAEIRGFFLADNLRALFKDQIITTVEVCDATKASYLFYSLVHKKSPGKNRD